jgi:hypothetical protein
MKISKTIKIIVGSILGIFLLLFIVLVVHIASIKPIDNPTVQISRIDFDKEFDSIGAIEIQKKLHEIPGVKTDIVVVRNTVVYYHDKKIANSKKVFDQLMAKGNYKAERFLVPDSLANKKVCPAMDENSYKYKFSRFIQRIFN